MASTIERIGLPQADTAELRILSAIFQNPDRIHEVRAHIRSGDFYQESRRNLYELLCKVVDNGKTIDIPQIVETLLRANKLNSIGGMDTISLIQQTPTDFGQAPLYYSQILQASRHRKFIRILHDYLGKATDPEADPDVLIAGIQDETIAMTHRDNEQSVKETAKSVLQKIQEIRSGKRKAGGISTSIRALDVITSGIKPAEYIVIAGRTGQGKSTLARQIVLNASRIGHHPLICSPEMTRDNIVECMAASVSEVSFDLIQDPTYMTADQFANVRAAIETISELPFEVDDSSGIDIGEMCARIRAKIMRGVDLVVVDYLQLLRVKSADSDYDRVTKASAALRDLAKMTRVPVIALSQLRRTGDEKEPPPTIYGLKESGNIENDAFQVWLIYRPKENNHYTGEDEIRVAKNRNGPCDIIPVFCDGPLLTFRERVR